MLADFNSYQIGQDPYANVELPRVVLSGTRPAEIKLSIMMSVFHRRSQLFRTLVTLTNQSFRDFEVLIYDNDDDQNLQELVSWFEPYLEIRYFKKPANTPRHFDPTPAFNYMFQHTRGNVVAIMQPECILMSDATHNLYFGHWYSSIWGYEEYKIRDTFPVPVDTWGETCVTLKTLWLQDKLQAKLDTVDWHIDASKVFDLPDFYSGGGLSGFSNAVWRDYKCQLWWLVFSFKRTACVWDAMKEFDNLRGHASIDFLLINYRDIKGYVDLMPTNPLAVHQDHHRMSVAPVGEQATVSKEALLEKFGGK